MERTKKNGGDLPRKEEEPEGNTEQEKEPEVPEEQKPEQKAEIEEEYVDPDPIISWKKLGGGSLRLAKRLIPPGATFKARLSEIPKAFRDVVKPLEELPVIPDKPALKVAKSVFQVVPRGKSKSMFDVISPNGKRMNELPLTKAVAERLAIDLA